MMTEKTITKKDFDAAVKNLLIQRGALYSEVREEAAIGTVNAVLKAMEWGIEPAPILPDVTGGAWECTENVNKNGLFVDSTNGVRLYKRGYTEHGRSEHLANGRVMAGSKKLVEVVVERLRAENYHRSPSHGPATTAVIDQLEKMFVDVTEFERGDT